MFVLNGIVYASEKRNDIEVISVKPLDDMIMILTFSTGEQRLFDATKTVLLIPVLKLLKTNDRKDF